MKDTQVQNATEYGRKTRSSCIWRSSGAVSAQTCESRPDDCAGCPVYVALGKMSAHKQARFFSRDYFDWCSVNACAVPGKSCPFAGPCMANWSRTSPAALRALTLMGVGGLSIGTNASLLQQLSRRTGLYADLLERVFALRNQGTLGPDDQLSPSDLELQSIEEQFALVAAAAFLDCLEPLDLAAFAESMFERGLAAHGLVDSFSDERTWEQRWEACRTVQALAVLDVLSAFDTRVLNEMQSALATPAYPSMAMARMALTVQRTLQPYTHTAPALEPGTVERAATLVGFARGLPGKVYQGLLVTPSELAAAVVVARGLGVTPEGASHLAGRVLADELLGMAAEGPLDMPRARPLLAGVAASGLVLGPDERTTLSRAVLRSFQAQFKQMGDMRANPAVLLACLGADNLVREGDQFEILASAREPVTEQDPALLGCEVPADRFYARGHAWVQPAEDGAVRIGLDDLAAHLVGSPDAVEMPAPGKQLRRGKPALRLIRGGESVDVNAPVSGEVIVVNQAIVDAPATLAEQPYQDGWLLAVRPTVSEDNLAGLMYGHNASDWQRDEMRRLRRLFQGKVATAADGARLAPDALKGIPGVRWSKVLRKFLKG